MAFGVAALFLATVGLYGVMAFSVSRRTQEIGVRMAMGAGARDVLVMVMRQGLWQIVTGIVLGAGLGVALGSAATLMLYRVSPYDPVILVGHRRRSWRSPRCWPVWSRPAAPPPWIR